MAASTSAPPRRRRKIEIDERKNRLLTGIFALEVIAIFVLISLPGVLPPGCPLSPSEAAAALLSASAILFPVIFIVKWSAGQLCAGFSRTVLAHLGDPVRKIKTRRKLEDQSWQLFIHTVMTVLEVYVLFYDEGGEAWLQDYRSLWTPHPFDQVNRKTSVHVLYLIQLAIWIVTCFSHRFLEERHKDYVMMYIHHLVTIALVAISYWQNFLRVGTVVLFLHDSSDIPIDLLKMTNYMKMEGWRGLFAVEMSFLSTLAVWGYTRLYLYPVRVVWYGAIYGSREVVTAPGAKGMEEFTIAAGSPYTRGHKPGSVIGDGSFSLLENLIAMPTHEILPGYWGCGALLVALLMMHVIWYALLWRLLFRMVAGEAGHDAGADEYEGDSDDDKED